MQQQLVVKLPGFGSVRPGVAPAALQEYFWTRSNTLDQVSYAEFGDPSSEDVVFYQHGWPGSRIGGSMLHEAAKQLRVRLIAVDRPGFGGTTFTPHHTLSSWASTLQQLSDQLHIQRFGILGASGGAPFAAACARFIPADRINGLGLLCPLGPVNGSTAAGLAAANSLLLGIANRCPAMARAIWRITRRWMQWDEDCMRRFALSPSDKAALKSAPQVAQAIRAAVLEGLAAGAWGVVHEMGLAQRCWGFNMEDIQVKHVFMWHGLQDSVVPVGMAKTYESIPGCKAVYFAGETHTTLVINKLCLALTALVKPAEVHNQLAAAAAATASAIPATAAAAGVTLDIPMVSEPVQAATAIPAATVTLGPMTSPSAKAFGKQLPSAGQNELVPDLVLAAGCDELQHSKDICNGPGPLSWARTAFCCKGRFPA